MTPPTPSPDDPAPEGELLSVASTAGAPSDGQAVVGPPATDQGAGGGTASTSLRAAVRRDPRHASELVLLTALAQLTPNVRFPAGQREQGDGTDPAAVDKRAKHIIRRATAVARRDGAITGSSFYLGMPSAMAMLYCHQILMVLNLAALYGHDPADPARAAEILVFQGRYADTEESSAALRAAGITPPPRERLGLKASISQSLRQLPGMIGMRVKKARSDGPLAVVISIATKIGYLLPVISMPAWAASSGRATRQLGRAARDFYRAEGGTPTPEPGIALPPRPRRRTRRFVVAAVILLATAFAWVTLVIVGHGHGHHVHATRWTIVLLAETFLLVTSARLLWITRAPAVESA